MERIASLEIATGFSIGVFNARGAQWRGEGGAQERELASKYRSLAKQRAFDYPHVSSVLESIAHDYDRESDWQDDRAQIDKRLR